MGKNQNVGDPVHTILWHNTCPQFGIKSGINVHFAFILEIQIHQIQLRYRIAQTLTRITLHAAKL